MKRILSTLLMLTMLVACMAGISVTAETNTEGMTFQAEDYYRTETLLTALPATYEATVKFPADYDPEKKGGAIMGNYQAKNIPGFQFRIDDGGKPGLIIVDDQKTYNYYEFDQINVYTGEWVHIAIVKDSAGGTLTCYINGEQKQTVTAASPENVEMLYTLGLGSDHQRLNEFYFQGSIRNAALYSDIRTADEIASDYAGTSAAEGLMVSYDLTQYGANSLPETIPDQSGNGLDLQLEHRWITEKEPVEDYAYSFAIVGDPQYLTLNHPEKLVSMYMWIAENTEEKNIQRVFTLGDLTHKDKSNEWLMFEAAIEELNDVVPYSLIRGNHDSKKQFTKNISFEDYGSTVDGTFDDTMLNTYKCFDVGNVPYLILALDYLPSDEVLEWANGIVAAHPDRNVIVMTHSYMNNLGNRISNTATGTLADDGDEEAVNETLSGNCGTDMWNKFICKHENITLVLCGHTYTTDLIKTVQEKGVHGNTVTQMVINPQRIDRELDGVGIVTMLYFSKDGSQVQVEHYSTVEEAYFLEENQFSFELDLIDGNASLNTIIWYLLGAGALLFIGGTLFLLLRKKKATAQPAETE
ncbi:MAG: metallophosphoesterase [Clostridia bacterium]|nr:metallophosphoesterase [Clostridia bacterium]